MEELDIPDFIETFAEKNLNIIQRVILSHNGTVQTLLSVILQEPVKVEILMQEKYGDTFLRWVALRTSGKIVGKAFSVLIPITPIGDVVMKDLKEGKLGLGQIIKKHGIATTRKINAIYKDEHDFGRIYTIESKEFSVIVTEVFSNAVFEQSVSTTKA